MMKRILIVVILLAIPACFGQMQTAKVRTYYIAADEVDWDYAPGGVNKMMGMKFEGYSTVFTERGPNELEPFIAKPCTVNTQTTPLPGSNPVFRSRSIREFLARSCEPRSVTPFASFSRITRHVRTVCIRMASSTEKTRRERRTTTVHPEPTKKMMPSLQARPACTPEKYLSGLDRDRMIRVRSSRSITLTPMS
jgi:hypothetical protein